MDANKIATHRDMYNASYDEVAADDKCFCYDEVYSMLSGRETVRNGSSYGYRQLVKCGDVARQDNFRPVVISYYENQEPLTTSFDTNHYSNTQLKFDAGDLTFDGEKHSTHKIRVQFDTTVDLLSGETYEQPITLGSSAEANIYSVGRYSSSSTVDDTVIIDLDQIEGSALDPNNKFVTFIVDGLKSITAQLSFSVKLPDTTGSSSTMRITAIRATNDSTGSTAQEVDITSTSQIVSWKKIASSSVSTYIIGNVGYGSSTSGITCTIDGIGKIVKSGAPNGGVALLGAFYIDVGTSFDTDGTHTCKITQGNITYTISVNVNGSISGDDNAHTIIVTNPQIITLGSVLILQNELSDFIARLNLSPGVNTYHTTNFGMTFMGWSTQQVGGASRGVSIVSGDRTTVSGGSTTITLG